MSPSDDLEASLRSLTPLPPALDRDRLMFQAGRASGSRRQRRLVFATVGALLLAVLVPPVAVTLNRREPRVERIFVTIPPAPPRPEKQAPVEQPPSGDETAPYVTEERWDHLPNLAHFRMEKQVLRWGLDGLQATQPPPGPLPPAEPLPRVRGRDF